MPFSVANQNARVQNVRTTGSDCPAIPNNDTNPKPRSVPRSTPLEKRSLLEPENIAMPNTTHHVSKGRPPSRPSSAR